MNAINYRLGLGLSEPNYRSPCTTCIRTQTFVEYLFHPGGTVMDENETT
jgi:hypothetical protein